MLYRRRLKLILGKTSILLPSAIWRRCLDRLDVRAGHLRVRLSTAAGCSDEDPHQGVARKLCASGWILLDDKPGLLLWVAQTALKPRAQTSTADSLRRLGGAQPDMIADPQKALHAGRTAGRRRGRAACSLLAHHDPLPRARQTGHENFWPSRGRAENTPRRAG